MASEEKSVDVSVLDELIDLRKQQELVDQFCARAEEMKVKVDKAVYERVIADYGTRRRALEAQAAPLVTRALAQYRKLRAVHNGVQRTHHSAQLDKDEVEFRHSLGEITDATQKERLVEPERILAESSAELATLAAQDARFREALPNVDLEGAAAPADAEAAAAASPDPTVVGLDATVDPEDAQSEDGQSEGAQSAGAQSVGAGPDPDSFVMEDLPELTFVEIAPDPVSRPHTVVSGEAVLLSEADDGQAVNYALVSPTYIGRAEDNQLRILDPGISRRHVLITATPTGFTIRDLKSQNGTYVNGERIDEVALTDGDRITLGEINLVFRSRAPDTRTQAS